MHAGKLNPVPPGSGGIAKETRESSGPLEDVPFRSRAECAFKDDHGNLLLFLRLTDPSRRVSGFACLGQDGVVQREAHRRMHVLRNQEARHDTADGHDTASDHCSLIIAVSEFQHDDRVGLVLDDGRIHPLVLGSIDALSEIERRLDESAREYGPAFTRLLERAFGEHHPWTRKSMELSCEARSKGPSNVVALAKRAHRFYVDGAIRAGQGLILVGWIAADEHDLVEIEIADTSNVTLVPFRTVEGRSTLFRTFRPDLKGVLGQPEFGHGRWGFVFHLKTAHEPEEIISINFNRGVPQEGIRVRGAGGEAEQFLCNSWIHAGEAIKALLTQVPEAGWMRAVADEVDCRATPYANRRTAACDHAFILNDRVLVMNGWIASPHSAVERVEIVAGSVRMDVSARLVRYPRPDQFAAYPWSRHEPIGMVCVLDEPEMLSCTLTVEVHLRGGYRALLTPDVKVVDWIGLTSFIREHTSLVGPFLHLLSRTSRLEPDQARLASRIEQLRLANLLAYHNRLPRMTERPEKLVASIERAYPLGEHGLLIIGWQFFPGGRPRTIRVYSENDCAAMDEIFIRLFRPDVSAQYSARFRSVSDWCGFAAVAPMPTMYGDVRAVRYDFGVAGESWLKIPTDGEPLVGERLARELSACIPVSTHAEFLLDLAGKTGSLSFQLTIEEQLSASDEQRTPERTAGCDLALSIEGQVLLLYGWLPMTEQGIACVELVSDEHASDITARLWRVYRDIPGQDRHVAWRQRHGFIAIVDGDDRPGVALWLRISYVDGTRQTIRVHPRAVTWATAVDAMAGHPGLLEHLPSYFGAYLTGMTPVERRTQAYLRRLMDQAFVVFHGQLTQVVERPDQLVAAIDRAYALGDGGVLLFGWHIYPGQRPCAVTLHGQAGEAARIDESMQPLLRKDVVTQYRARHPTLTEWCGFMAWVDVPTEPGDKRALRFDFGEQGEVWLKVPLAAPVRTGVALAREVLNMIPEPERMSHLLYRLFDAGLGRAVEAVCKRESSRSVVPEVRQFGSAGVAPEVSVIVPLYGRYDFVRHQLAQFASDTDFTTVDLIYVVDDPSIVAETLELAARYQPLFRVPFRVVWYHRNLGFSGANNVGASLARGKYLVLLNSDVLPQRSGWLGSLKTALKTLPAAGAVGPLLEFADGTVQHAGMYPTENPALPGFLLNTHRGMGMAWTGGAEPFEPPMLTAACMMMRTRDYQQTGGLDERYLIGDFEDSDLCLALRKRGKRLWLVPDTRLWHLERQSQEHGNSGSQRQLLTLYNAWRYRRKILNGELVDPTTVEAGA